MCVQAQLRIPTANCGSRFVCCKNHEDFIFKAFKSEGAACLHRGVDNEEDDEEDDFDEDYDDDDEEDEEEFEEEDDFEDYEEMTTKELYKLCKERELKLNPKYSKKRAYLIKQLEKDDDLPF